MKVRQLSAVFILGVIFGAAVINFTLGQRLENLYWEKEELKVDLYETTERLKKLESEQITDGQRKIQEIKIELETEESPFIELGIKQKITEITEELVGTEIDNLNHYLTYKLIDGRTLEVEGKQYTLTVNLLIIAETTTYHISVQAKDEGNNEDNRK